MNGFDSQLGSRLHDLVDGEPGSAPPTAIMLERGRRGRRRRTAALVSASCAVLAVAAVVVVTATRPAAPAGPGITAATPAPRLELAAAITASQNLSYKFTDNFQVVARPGATLTDGERSDLSRYGAPGTETTGAFDPATSTGFLRQARPGGEASEVRLINGVRYSGKTWPGGGEWRQEDGRYTNLGLGAHDRKPADTVDPTELLEVLQHSGSVTGSQANTYHFTVVLMSAPLPGGGSSPQATLTGDVVVGADGKVSRVTYEESIVEDGGRVRALINRYNLGLSDYGTPVKVERPTVR
jgi:hypothetical protein